jgi:DNA-binding SARP family transcriptional activator
MGEVARARAAFAESEKLFRETGDKWSIAAILSAQAGITDQLDVARALYEEVYAIFQEFEHKEQSMVSLSNLASIALLQGDTTRAQNLYEQTLAQARELQNKATIAFCLRGLGRLYIAHSDFDAAENHLHEALALDQETGHQIWVALSLAGVGRIAAIRGQALQAARALGAIDAFLKANAINLDNDDQLELGQHDSAIRASMTPQEFDAGFVAGHALTLEQALEEISRVAQEDKREAQPSVPASDVLRLYALGATRVFLGEQALGNWSYARVKELLFYLVTHPARTRAQIGLALWPDASPTQLRNSFSTALYHLRRALGNPEWIVFEEEQYRFNRALNYRFDVEAFELNLIQAGNARTPQTAIALLEEAINLYQGDFVEDYLEGEWFLLRREDLRRKYLDALIDLGRLRFQQADFVRAAGMYRRAIEKDEMLEEAHRELMRCYARLGERGQALRHYQTLEQIMQDELGSPPASESIALYQQLKRGEEI